jgi:hypothetical protein
MEATCKLSFLLICIWWLWYVNWLNSHLWNGSCLAYRTKQNPPDFHFIVFSLSYWWTTCIYSDFHFVIFSLCYWWTTCIYLFLSCSWNKWIQYDNKFLWWQVFKSVLALNVSSMNSNESSNYFTMVINSIGNSWNVSKYYHIYLFH